MRSSPLPAFVAIMAIILSAAGCSGGTADKARLLPEGTMPAAPPEGVEAPAEPGDDAAPVSGTADSGSTATENEPAAPLPPATPPPPLPKTSKVCQLTGEYDRHLKQKTLNLTASRYNLYGTDLGASFPFNDRIYFLFGDSWRGTTSTAFTIYNRDAIAYAEIADLAANECIKLTFESEQATPSDPVNYLPINIVGGDVGHDGFEVPVGGFENAGDMYVFFATDAEYYNVAPLPSQRITPTRSVLAKRVPGEQDFAYIYDLSTYTHVPGTYYPNLPPSFMSVSPVIVDSATTPDLPKPGKGLLLFGSGFYRQSKVYLAYVSMEDIEKRSPVDGMPGRYRPTDIHFFAGLDSSNKPIWRADWDKHNSEAAPLFEILGQDSQPRHDVGELSVVFDPLTAKFYMTYQSYYDRGVHFRYASQAAPWLFSQSQKIFLPEMGYGVFIHSALLDDGLNDPGRLTNGGEYGPYMIPQMFTLDALAGKEEIYFVLSTWNPYQVVLMKSELRVQ